MTEMDYLDQHPFVFEMCDSEGKLRTTVIIGRCPKTEGGCGNHPYFELRSAKSAPLAMPLDNIEQGFAVALRIISEGLLDAVTGEGEMRADFGPAAWEAIEKLLVYRREMEAAIARMRLN